MKKKIRLRIINKDDPTDFEEGLIDAKIWAKMEADKKKTRLSWANYISKLLDDYKKAKKN